MTTTNHSVASAAVMSGRIWPLADSRSRNGVTNGVGDLGERLGTAADTGDGGRRAVALECLVPPLSADGLDGAQQALGDGLAGIGYVRQFSGDLGRAHPSHPHEDLPDQLVLVRHVAIDRRPRASGPLGDLVDAHTERAGDPHDCLGRFDQASAQIVRRRRGVERICGVRGGRSGFGHEMRTG